MTQKFVTLPREVVEQALEAWARGCPPDCKDGMTDSGGVHPCGEAALIECPSCQAVEALRAVLDHPQNHVPDAGNMVPAGWKLVPVEPTDDMLYDIQEFSHILPPRGKRIWAHMLNAAPQPPTVKDSLTVEQPQANQPAMTPIAQRKLDSLLAEGYTISGYSIYHEQKHQLGFVTGAGLVGWWRPDGMEYPQPQGEQEPVGFVRQIDIEQIAKTPSDWGAMSGRVMGFNTVPVYTHPQPKRETLTDEKIDKLCPQFDDPMRREMWIIGFKAAHNVK